MTPLCDLLTEHLEENARVALLEVLDALTDYCDTSGADIPAIITRDVLRSVLRSSEPHKVSEPGPITAEQDPIGRFRTTRRIRTTRWG
jgi:hypothetical protein